ncbi:hypothetical protein ACFL5V_10785 [Fibrobacterota bacterium]
MTNLNGSTWYIPVPLMDYPVATPYNGRLEFYFKGVITATVQTHRSATAEQFDGGQASASLTTAYPNVTESVTLIDPSTGGTVTRRTDSVQVCVEDQVFSTAQVDAITLYNIECQNSGDQIPDVILYQLDSASTSYCGYVNKTEAQSNSISNDTLACQNGDLLTANYIDPVYGTEASVTVSLVNPVPVQIWFSDLDGNVITSYPEGMSTSKFMVWVIAESANLNAQNQLNVTLTSGSGDQTVVTVTETAVANQTFVAEVEFGFSNAINPADNVIEGLIDPNLVINQDVVTASVGGGSGSLTITAAYVPITKTWIIDGNADGKADSIYIEFAAPIAEVPDLITSIDWPSEGDQSLSATSDLAEIQMVAGTNNTRIVVVLTGDPFPQDATQAGAVQPSLVLPDNNLFQGQASFIQDSIGPVVVSAVKYPSDLDRDTVYEAGEMIHLINPDTLLILFSEPLVRLAGGSWDSLLIFVPGGCGGTGFEYPLITYEEPIQLPNGTWQFVVSNKPNVMKPKAEDCLYFNPDAPFTDLYSNGTAEKPVSIEGMDYPEMIYDSDIYNGVEGFDFSNPQSIITLGELNPAGVLEVPGLLPVFDPVTGQAIQDPATGMPVYRKRWFQPQHLNPDGTVNELAQAVCNNTEEAVADVVPYPENCLSTVFVYSETPYTAKIMIYDHLGKFIHQSTQKFGYCGEMNNPYRNKPDGFLSFLVWNQKEDLNQTYVKDGVYIWKVKYEYPGYPSFTGYYRQGIVRTIEPTAGCATAAY